MWLTWDHRIFLRSLPCGSPCAAIPTQTLKSRVWEVLVWPQTLTLGPGQMTPSTRSLLSKASCPEGVTHDTPSELPGLGNTLEIETGRPGGGCLTGLRSVPGGHPPQQTALPPGSSSLPHEAGAHLPRDPASHKTRPSHMFPSGNLRA